MQIGERALEEILHKLEAILPSYTLPLSPAPNYIRETDAFAGILWKTRS